MMRTVKLWFMTALALAIAGLAVHEALAQAPGLKPPPSVAAPPVTLPAPLSLEPPAEVWEQHRFYLVPSEAMARVSEIIQKMLYEIQRLEAIVAKRSCI